MRKAVAAWRANYYDAASDSLIDLTGHGLHARLGSAVGPDTNDPMRLSYSGQKTVYLPGVSGNFASTPDSAAVSVTSDIDIRVLAALDDWTPASDNVLMAKWSTGNSFIFRVQSPGTLQLVLSNDGSTVSAASSSVAPSVADKSQTWVRVTWRASDGRTQFFTSTDGASWLQLGSNATISIPSIFDGPSLLTVGARSNAGTVEPMSGRILRALLFNGIAGTLVADFDASRLTEPYATYVATTGETWTLNRSATGRKLAVVDRDLLLLGTDDYLEVADNALLDFAAGESFTVAVAIRRYGFTTGGGVHVGKGNINSSIQAGWLNYSLGNPTRNARLTIQDGTAVVHASSTGNYAEGAVVLLSGVLDRGTQLLRSFVGVIGGTAVSTAAIGSLANSLPLRIGGSSVGGGFNDMEFIGAAIIREALSADQLRRLAREFGL